MQSITEATQNSGVSGARLGRLRIGTAGFTSTHWLGKFYPPHAKKSEGQLDCCQETFDIVEVNSIFHGIPHEETMSNWRKRAAEGFQLGLKLSKIVTHEGEFASEQALGGLQLFLERAGALGPHLGPLLFQFPRNLHINLKGLEKIAAVLDACSFSKHCRVAIELRNRSSIADLEVLGFLRAKSWAFVHHPNSVGRASTGGQSNEADAGSYPLADLEDVVTADFVYVRLHGDNGAHILLQRCRIDQLCTPVR